LPSLTFSAAKLPDRWNADIQLLRVRLIPVFERHSVQIRTIRIDLSDAPIQQVNAVAAVEKSASSV
jgi:hypothetical protein